MAHVSDQGPRRRVFCVSGAALLAGCSGLPKWGVGARKETLRVLTKRLDLLTVNAGLTRQVQKRVAVTGLAPGDTLVGMDFRPGRGQLYALSQRGVLYTLDVDTGQLKAVSGKALDRPMDGLVFGVDIHPVMDQLRVVSNTGYSIRMNLDTGALVAIDVVPAYAPGDVQAAFRPDLAALASSTSPAGRADKSAPHFAIDRRAGSLVALGPQAGVLRTVGQLGTGALSNASFDIADETGAALVAVSAVAQAATRLYLVSLETGKADLLGILGDGDPILGLAVQP